MGRLDAAAAAYRRALELSEAGPERRFLESRLVDIANRGLCKSAARRRFLVQTDLHAAAFLPDPE